MPLIPFPNVPDYPGVPSVPRTAPGSPDISISLAMPQNPSPASQAPYADNWGIFNSETDAALYTPMNGGTLSFFSLSYARPMLISDFPIEANDPSEGAAFASFNKVWQPANPVVTFALGGSSSEQAAFLAALDAATASTNLYDVITPDANYLGYSIESYSFRRTAQRGATMLTVDISLKQILQVSASFTNSSINSPQSPSAKNPENGGLVQGEKPLAAVQALFPNVKIIGTVP